MPIAVIPSFLLYCYVSGITPGPANLCSLATSLKYGKSVALRQWRGLFTGFFLDSMAAVLINSLLGNVLGPYVKYLSWIGALYILYLAWHILRSAGITEQEVSRQPNFRTGLLVNLTNVKVIVFCITALGTFVLPYTSFFGWLLGVGLFLPLTGPICNLVWLFAGDKLKHLLSAHQRAVDIVMSISLLLCAISLVWQR